MTGRFVRLAELDRPSVAIEIDGAPALAREGDTVLVAVLAHTGRLRLSEFDGPRAGFCLMGACQDCWVRTVDGAPLQACMTTVSPGLRLLTGAADASWPSRG